MSKLTEMRDEAFTPIMVEELVIQLKRMANGTNGDTKGILAEILKYSTKHY